MTTTADSATGRAAIAAARSAGTAAIAAAIAVAAALSQGCRQRDVRVAEIAVPGVRGAASEQRVRRAIASLKGVDAARACFTGGVLRVSYDSMQLGLKNLEHAITDAGFDANELKAGPAVQGRAGTDATGAR